MVGLADGDDEGLDEGLILGGLNRKIKSVISAYDII